MTKLTQMTLDEDGVSHRRIHLREISGGDTPLETVGQDLRAARLRRGDDLATVSRSLKIRKDHLDSLEEDRIESLPGKTYAIGFVRSYAHYLGLNGTEFAERFKQEISGRPDDHAHAVVNLHEEEPKKLGYGWRIMAGLIILALVFGAWHIFFGSRDSAPGVPPAPVLTGAAQTPPPSQAVSTVAMPPPALSNAPATPGPAAIPPPAAGPVTLAKPPADQAQQAAVPAVPDAAGQVFGGLNKNPRVVLRARGATRIEVKGSDGMVYINRMFNSGDSYRLPNIVGLSLVATNAGAIEVDLDGIAMGRAGGDLQPVDNIALDPQAIVDRSNSR